MWSSNSFTSGFERLVESDAERLDVARERVLPLSCGSLASWDRVLPEDVDARLRAPLDELVKSEPNTGQSSR